MFTKIICLYEERKKKLSNVLSNRDDIKLENQHQIYGAINEIDMLLRTLREYQNSYEKSIYDSKEDLQMQNNIGDKIKPNSDADKIDNLPKDGGLFSRFFRK